jgi:hypothetical protein
MESIPKAPPEQPRPELRGRGPDKEEGKLSVEEATNSATLAGQLRCREVGPVRAWEQATPCHAAEWATPEWAEPWVVGWVRRWPVLEALWAAVRAWAAGCPWAADMGVECEAVRLWEEPD